MKKPKMASSTVLNCSPSNGDGQRGQWTYCNIVIIYTCIYNIVIRTHFFWLFQFLFHGGTGESCASRVRLDCSTPVIKSLSSEIE